MKRIILAASIVSLMFLSQPAFAADEHQHQTSEGAPAQTQEDAGKIQATVQSLEEMREKIAKEQDPAARGKLMQQHMQMMRQGMQMMSGMGGMQGMQSGKPMSMEDRMAMMEKHMAMMQKKTDQGCPMMKGGMGGGMMGGGMMGCMGGAHGKNMDEKMEMMEKKIMMMQEVINGMMTQHEMMAK